MRLLTTAFIAAIMLSSCKAAPQLATAAAPTNADSSNLKPGDPLSPLDKDGSAKSAFDNVTVLRLNAIVQRSKDMIDEFDKVAPEMRASVDAAKGKAANSPETQKARTSLTRLGEMHTITQAAKTDLAAEGQKLADSQKYYDVVVFSGMVTFVQKVEGELSDEIKDLNAKLN